MDILVLFLKTIALRPYVFLFLAAFLFAAIQLIGWPRTWRFWLISWATAFVCEYSSTRTGIPFGWYFYNGSTVGQELYFSNVPFMDSISFSFLLFAAYGVALSLRLPFDSSQAIEPSLVRPLRFDVDSRTSWPVYAVTAFLFFFIDMVIDPVALRGPRRPARPARPAPPPATGAARERIVREAAAVDDAELRELIARVRITHDR